MKLSCDEKKALRDYKNAGHGPNNSPCFALNKKLNNSIKVCELPTDLRKVCENLDSSFQNHERLDKEKTVYRGVGFRCNIPYSAGESFRNLSFWSCSYKKNVAERFIKVENPLPKFGALIELNLPAGFPIIDIDTVFDTQDGEAEVLLPRNILWKVEEFNLSCPGFSNKSILNKFCSIALIKLNPIYSL